MVMKATGTNSLGEAMLSELMAQSSFKSLSGDDKAAAEANMKQMADVMAKAIVPYIQDHLETEVSIAVTGIINALKAGVPAPTDGGTALIASIKLALVTVRVKDTVK